MTFSQVDIMNEQWDYLIVLDACRYDYFERFYKEHLGGKLKKKITPGTGTIEWRDKSFTGYYEDTIYISTNPYINSNIEVKGFSGKDHFNKIYDLWLDNWDEEKGTVLPEVVTKRSVEIIVNHADKRAIIHFVQPHEPYIGSKEKGPGYKLPKPDGIVWGLQKESWIIRKIINFSAGIFYWLGIRGNKLIWNIRRFLGMPPACPMDAVRLQFGDEGLRKAYEDNLKAVLPHVAELVDHLSGRIIVTADHGEMLGEDGCYCHWSRSNKKQLREVPWLVIQRGRKEQRASKKGEQTNTDKSSSHMEKKISERLKALGYMV